MFGSLYDLALTGERCWVRHDDGGVSRLPVHAWLGGRGADTGFDDAIVGMCDGPTIDLGCGPGRLVAALVRRGVPALGVDLSPAAGGPPRCAATCSARCPVWAAGRPCCWPTAPSASAVTPGGCCGAPPICSAAAAGVWPNSIPAQREWRPGGSG